MVVLPPARPGSANPRTKGRGRLAASDGGQPLAQCAAALQRHVVKESRARHGDILYRRLALMMGGDPLKTPRTAPQPSPWLSPFSRAVSPEPAPLSGGPVSPLQGEVMHGAPLRERPAPPIGADANFQWMAVDGGATEGSGHKGATPHSPPRKQPHRAPLPRPASAAAATASLQKAVAAQRQQRQQKNAVGSHRLRNLAGWNLADLTADLQPHRSPTGASSTASPGKAGAGSPSPYSRASHSPGSSNCRQKADGFASLHSALSRMVQRLGRQGVNISDAFHALAAHVANFRIDLESQRLAALHEEVSQRLTDRGAGRSAFAALAFFFLDHALCLHSSMRPALADVLCKCRDALVESVYCLESNMLPEAISGMLSPRTQKAVAEAVYSGPPVMPTRQQSETVVGELSEHCPATVEELLEPYERPRMNFADNFALQEELAFVQERMADTRDQFHRELVAETAVARYWKVQVKSRLFYAWRRVLARRDEERQMHEDALLMQRDIERQRRIMDERERQRRVAEIALRGEIDKGKMRCKELEEAVTAEQESREREKEKVRQKNVELLQKGAEVNLLRERLEKVAQKAGDAEARMGEAMRQRDELKGRLDEAEQHATRFRQAVAGLMEAATETQSALAPSADHETLLQQMKPIMDTADEPSGRLLWNDAGAPGALWRWFTALSPPDAESDVGSQGRQVSDLQPSQAFCMHFICGLRTIFPAVVSAKEVAAVQSDKSPEHRSGTLYNLLRRALGTGAPCPLHPAALSPPGTPVVGAGALTVLLLHLVAPPSEKQQATRRRSLDQDCSDVTAEEVRRTAGALRRAQRDAAQWRRALHSCLCDFIAIASGDSVPEDPTEWAPSLGRAVAALPERPLPEVESAVSRMRTNAGVIASLRSAYAMGGVVLDEKGVWSIFKDAGLMTPAKEEGLRAAVIPALARGALTNVQADQLAEAVLRAAAWKYPAPRVRSDDAVEGLIRNALLPLCTAPALPASLTASGISQGVSELWRKYGTHVGALHAAYAEGAALNQQGFVDLLAACQVLRIPEEGEEQGRREREKDSWRHLSPSAAAQIYTAALPPQHSRRGTGGLRYPEFLQGLGCVAAFCYPNPTVPLRARARRLLHEHLVPVAVRLEQQSGAQERRQSSDLLIG
eukprot:TRINITY_DN70203_c0_g1_i1.p1 TRINITY_DN70203_c0_g1~~TRINITY_DN70203_c0_g1_i1.p1  ORF type:complete len:1168 (+),score=319.42 TRINITY_DN70203_c0_g1_i1:79-3504(+)